MKPVRHQRHDPALAKVLGLIRESFAYMDGRIDPPSSMHRLTVDDLSDHCETGEVWSLGDPLVACVVLSERPEALYLGKLAVAEGMRGRGLARQMIELTAERARALGKSRLELQTRIQLIENQQAFVALGFEKVGETAHPGFDRPTSVTMVRRV